MRESHKCLVIAVLSVLVHVWLLLGRRRTGEELAVPTTSAPDLGSAPPTASSRRITPTNLDLSTLSPLQTLTIDGKQEKTLFTNMFWNVSDSLGDRLNFRSYNTSMRYQLLVDVGLETGSGLMCMLQEAEHTSKVLLGLESHPLNFGLTSHNMLKGNPNMKEAKERTLLLPFAVADVDKYIKFNENYAPACGSILQSAQDAWWCAVTTNVLHVPALSLNTLLSFVPSNYDFHYLKIDVEGAEELVLRGGLAFLHRFKMISLEINLNTTNPNRINETNNDSVNSLLRSAGFIHKKCEKKRSYDCHYTKRMKDTKEAVKLHALAIHSTRRGGQYTYKKCKEIYLESYVGLKKGKLTSGHDFK